MQPTAERDDLPTSASPFAVRLCGVRKRFPGTEPGAPDVLAGVDLDVRAGEFLSIVGPSGCGKSTLLAILAGLEPPTGGTLEVDREHLAVVFQRPLLLPWRDALDNATFALECRGRRARDVRSDARQLLVRMGLGEALNLLPHELSVGMRQRVDLARALLVKPRLLLLDEPFASLDPGTRASMHHELLDAWREGGFTAVLVSHDLEEVVSLSDRIVFLTDRPARVEAVVEVDLPRPRAADVGGRITLLRRVEELRSR